MSYYHFAPEDLRLAYDDGRQIVVGETLTVPGPIVLCKWGLHASQRAVDALTYAPLQSALTVVDLGGEMVVGDDKIAATERTCVAILSADRTERMLRTFACRCVRETPLGDGRVVWDLLTDARSRAAVEVAERYVAGRATKEDLYSARAAASDASNAISDAAGAADWSSAGAAARATARAARAASNAARAAGDASDAARYAAWAASDAARYAAWAASDTTKYATKAASREWQADLLEHMIAESLAEQEAVA